MRQCFWFGCTSKFEKICCGVRLVESCIFGDSFIITVAIRIAYGHKLVDMELGQRLFACIVIVRASPWMVLIRLSANPFWWWAPTPANVNGWSLARQSLTYKFARNMPLSAWYDFISTPYCLEFNSNALFPSSIFSASVDFWKYVKPNLDLWSTVSQIA